MQEIYLNTFVSVLVVSVLSFSGLFALSLKEHVLRKYVFLLVALAVGALFGDAFLHLIPETFEEFEKLGKETLGNILVIVGVFLFLVLEKILHWHHHEDDERSIHHTGKMILISDGLHNFIDGAIVATGYLAGIQIGIATTLAIILHEIPQEVGDFGVLLHSGYSKKRALFLNFISALLAIAGAGFALLLSKTVDQFIIYLLPIAAGGFIYIAGSDLVPELHKTKSIRRSLAQLGAIILGILAMVLLLFVELS